MAVPLLPPVATPVEVMLTTEVSLLLHVPPALLSVNVTVSPRHTVRVPDPGIAGMGLTVTACVV